MSNVRADWQPVFLWPLPVDSSLPLSLPPSDSHSCGHSRILRVLSLSRADALSRLLFPFPVHPPSILFPLAGRSSSAKERSFVRAKIGRSFHPPLFVPLFFCFPGASGFAERMLRHCRHPLDSLFREYFFCIQGEHSGRSGEALSCN